MSVIKGSGREAEKRLTPPLVEEGIRQAREWAEQRGIPLTLERVAACLGIDRDRLRELATSPGKGETARQLRQVYLDCNAALIEELMACKSSHGGAMLLAKNDFGYTDKGDAVGMTEPVRFVGEDKLEA